MNSSSHYHYYYFIVLETFMLWFISGQFKTFALLFLAWALIDQRYDYALALLWVIDWWSRDCDISTILHQKRGYKSIQSSASVDVFLLSTCGNTTSLMKIMRSGAESFSVHTVKRFLSSWQSRTINSVSTKLNSTAVSLFIFLSKLHSTTDLESQQQGYIYNFSTWKYGLRWLYVHLIFIWYSL